MNLKRRMALIRLKLEPKRENKLVPIYSKPEPLKMERELVLIYSKLEPEKKRRQPQKIQN